MAIPRRFILCAGGLLVLVLGAGIGGCFQPPTDGDGDGNGEVTPADTFPTSLHATREGKAHFYNEHNGGFEVLTGVPMSDLPCQACHGSTYADGTEVDAATYQPGCKDCHADPDNPTADVADDTCLGCHSRQKNEQNFFTDVHRDSGMACMSCHSADEMHGDGTAYVSIHESPSAPTCEGCHTEGGQGGAIDDTTLAHGAIHANLGCSACHVQSVISCYNCHFDTQVAGAGKRFFSPPNQGFKMLVQRDGKITTATFQSLVYEGQSFYTIAPYYAHSIYRPDPSTVCNDCHASAAAAEYNETGMITVADWDHEAGQLVGPTGVIPIPPDWRTALQFDYLDYTAEDLSAETDPAAWEFLRADTNLNQMLFAEPLTEEQMAAFQP